MVVLIGDQRAVDVLGNIPAKRLIQAVVFGRGGNVLIASDNVGNAHQMVIDDVGKVVGRIAVGFDEDHVVQFLVLHRDVSVEFVVEGRCAFGGVVLADDIGLTLRKIFFNLFLRQMQAVLVVHADFLAIDDLGQRRQSLLCAEAAVGLSLVDQFLRVFAVNTGAHALTLHIRANAAVLVGTFVLDEAGIGHCALDDIDSAFHIASLIGIFDPQNEIAVFVLGNQIGVKSGSEIAHMHSAGGTGSVSGSDFHVVFPPCISMYCAIYSCILYCLPVLPKPPSPRSVSVSESDSSKKTGR